MYETCPVCKTKCTEKASKCKTCGFNDLHRTFINVDEGNHWVATVVTPYRIKWEADKREAELLALLEESRQREAESKAQLEKMHQDVAALAVQVEKMHQEVAALTAQVKKISRQIEDKSLTLQENYAAPVTQPEQTRPKETKSPKELFEIGENFSLRYYPNAVQYYRKAAEQGYAPAQNALGDMYYYGRCVTRDYVEAVRWYRKSAEKGDSDAQNRLGDMYRDGHGVAPNDLEAFKLYHNAANQGSASARNKLEKYYGRLTGSRRTELTQTPGWREWSAKQT